MLGPRRTTEQKLLTIDEYLNLSDWTFDSTFEQGEQGSYFWTALNYYLEFEKFIPEPKTPYRILVTHYDGFGGAASCYNNTAGWNIVGRCAISDPVSGKNPQVNYAADTALMWLDTDLDLASISDKLNLANEEIDPSNPALWTLIESLQPYLFISYIEKEFFASRDKAVIDALHSAEALANAEAQERAQKSAYRNSVWHNIGPECGPEKCIEGDCDRLRIKLAVRCFVHQLRAESVNRFETISKRV